MKSFRFASHASAGIVLLLVANSLASAQATRTWVSGVGDDVNPCSRTAPCKTFAGAISKTAVGGEINCIDAGGFGAVTITKSLTIDGNGTHAAILAAGTNGVIVNAPAGSTVTLRNLSINGVGTGVDGIRYIGGDALFVENCVVSNFTGQGIDGALAGTFVGKVFVKDSIFRKCAGGGIQLTPVLANTSTITAVLDNVRLEANSLGIQVNDRAKATLSNCVVSGNTNQGVFAFANAAAGPVVVNMETCTIASNGSLGIRANNANVNVRLSNVAILNNGAASTDVTGGGIITSFVNNRIIGNTPDVALPTTKAQQ